MHLDDGRCVLTLYPEDGSTDLLSWKTIYEATTEMEAKCVRTGKGAVVTNLGKIMSLSRVHADERC